MENGIMLVGQSPVFQAEAGKMVQMDLYLSVGQQRKCAPIAYSGRVIDHTTRLPVADAWVTLRNGPYLYRCRTLRDGRFEFILPNQWSAANIQVMREGYHPRYIGMHLLDYSNDVFYIY